MAETKGTMAPVARLIGATAVIGPDIFDAEGVWLGEIRDVMLNELSEKIEFVILNLGGHFVGVNQRYDPLPWRLLKFDQARRGYIVCIDYQKLDDAPTCEFSDTGSYLDDGSDRRVIEYFGAVSG